MGAYIGITGISKTEEIRIIWNLITAEITNVKIPSVGFGLIHYLFDQSKGLSIQRLKALSLAVEEYSLGNQAIIHLNGWLNTRSAEIQSYLVNSMLPSSAVLQINKFDWSTESFSRLKSAFPRRKFILPFNRSRTSIDECIKVLQAENGCRHTLLIDSSEGSGEICDMDEVEWVVTQFQSIFPYLSLGIAGGFGVKMSSETITMIKKLMPVSVDAESGLAVNGVLDLKCVSAYLSGMLKIHRTMQSARSS